MQLATNATLEVSVQELRELIRTSGRAGRIEVGRWEAVATALLAIAALIATNMGIAPGAARDVPAQHAIDQLADALGFLDDDASSAAMPWDDAVDCASTFAAWFAADVTFLVLSARTSGEAQTLVVGIDARGIGAAAVCDEAGFTAG